MSEPDARITGASKAIRRLRWLILLVTPFLAFCILVRLPPPSTPISRMMAEALPEAAGARVRTDAAGARELSFVRSVAGPDDWVCSFWNYQPVVELVRRDTGRSVSANMDKVDDGRAWALVIGDQAHVMLIWASYVRDRRRGADAPTYRQCTRVAETRVLKQGAYLVLEDAE